MTDMLGDSVVVDEVRRHRMALHDRFDGDRERYTAYLREVQERYAEYPVRQLIVSAGKTAGEAKE